MTLYEIKTKTKRADGATSYLVVARDRAGAIRDARHTHGISRAEIASICISSHNGEKVQLYTRRGGKIRYLRAIPQKPAKDTRRYFAYWGAGYIRKMGREVSFNFFKKYLYEPEFIADIERLKVGQRLFIGGACLASNARPDDITSECATPEYHTIRRIR